MTVWVRGVWNAVPSGLCEALFEWSLPFEPLEPLEGSLLLVRAGLSGLHLDLEYIHVSAGDVCHIAYCMCEATPAC